MAEEEEARQVLSNVGAAAAKHRYGEPTSQPNRTRRDRRDVGRIGGCVIINLYMVVLEWKKVFMCLVPLAFVLVVCYALKPDKPTKAYVNTANLTRFDLIYNDTTTSLVTSYNLNVSITIRNPNIRVSYFYESPEATVSYKGMRFGFLHKLPSFYLRDWQTTDVILDFQGQSAIKIVNATDVISVFNDEKKVGIYNIDVKVYGLVDDVIGRWYPSRKNEINCNLRIPLASFSANGMFLIPEFQSTECSVTIS